MLKCIFNSVPPQIRQGPVGATYGLLHPYVFRVPKGHSNECIRFFSDDNNSFLLSFKNLNLSYNCSFPRIYSLTTHDIISNIDLTYFTKRGKYSVHSFSGPLELYMHTNTQKTRAPVNMLAGYKLTFCDSQGMDRTI